jgi:iron complex outermembrane receptor protein
MMNIRAASVTTIILAAGLLLGVVGAEAQEQTPQAQAAPIELAEVTITAEKRDETIEKAPADVTVVSGADLAALGITTTVELSNVLPSARFNTENTETKLFLRGIGSDIGFPWVAESVSTYINGGLVQRFGSSASFFDIGAIEILPGPQGTLYGRNSVGGTIQVTTARPSFVNEEDAMLEYGNYDLIHIAGVVNVPLDDTLAVRFAINTESHNGYQTSGNQDEGSQAGRFSAIWKPTEDFSAFIWAQYWQDRYHSAAWQNLPYPDPSNPWYVPAVKPSYAGMPGQISLMPLSDTSVKTLGGQFEWHIPGMTLSYIPYWSFFDTDEKRPVDGFDEPWKNSINELSHELRLSSDPGGALSWLAGVTYLRSLGFVDWSFGPNLAGNLGNFNARSSSAYAQATYAIVPWLRATAGLRYSDDLLSAPDSYTVSTNGFTTGNFGPVYTPFVFDHAWDRLDWKAGLEADAGSHSLIYGNVQTGYNEGTYNAFPGTAQLTNLVKPTSLLGFTLGAKNRFLDGRLEINDELYYYIYHDFLLSAFNGATGGSVTTNAPRAESKGDELDIKYLLTRYDLLSVSVGLLDAKITQFVDGSGRNFADSRLPNSPYTTFNLGLQHTFELNSGSSLVLRVDSLLSDGYWGVFTEDNQYLYQKAYTKTTASLTFKSANGKWDVGAWVRNAENVATLAAAAVGGLPGPDGSYIDPPRTFGIKLHTHL